MLGFNYRAFFLGLKENATDFSWMWLLMYRTKLHFFWRMDAAEMELCSTKIFIRPKNSESLAVLEYLRFLCYLDNELRKQTAKRKQYYTGCHVSVEPTLYR